MPGCVLDVVVGGASLSKQHAYSCANICVYICVYIYIYVCVCASRLSSQLSLLPLMSPLCGPCQFSSSNFPLPPSLAVWGCLWPLTSYDLEVVFFKRSLSLGRRSASLIRRHSPLLMYMVCVGRCMCKKWPFFVFEPLLSLLAFAFPRAAGAFFSEWKILVQCCQGS